MSELSEIREQYVILLLGATEKPIPTIRHVQKEMFILSKMQPKIQELFHFEKHYEGPYSQPLQESVRDPRYYDRAYNITSRDSIFLRPNGRKIFLDLVEQTKDDRYFTILLNSLRMIRSIYDKLTKEELLFIIYDTYPDYIEYSNVYDNLVNNKDRREKIINNLRRKGLITKNRYEELLENDS